MAVYCMIIRPPECKNDVSLTYTTVSVSQMVSLKKCQILKPRWIIFPLLVFLLTGKLSPKSEKYQMLILVLTVLRVIILTNLQADPPEEQPSCSSSAQKQYSSKSMDGNADGRLSFENEFSNMMLFIQSFAVVKPRLR